MELNQGPLYEIIIPTNDERRGPFYGGNTIARIRTIKPGFFLNEELAEMPAMTRLFFIGLWSQVDREGRCEDRPKRLKASLFPYEDVDVDVMLCELAQAGHLVRYEVDGVRILEVSNFLKHQRPHHKEDASILPKIPVDFKHDSSMTQAWPKHESCKAVLVPQEGKGTGREQEGKGTGMEINTAPSPADSTPPFLTFDTVGRGAHQWHLTDDKVKEYGASFPGVDVRAECRKAWQWCRDNPTKRKTAAGVPAFLSRWLGKAQNFGGSGFKSPVKPDGLMRAEDHLMSLDNL